MDEELNRIRDALLANPVIVAIEGSGTIGIDTTPTTVRLGIGDTPEIDVPGGAWDSTLGDWTVSLSGIYTFAVQAFIAAFGPGNKSYQATLEVFVNSISRGVQITGGADDVPLALNLSKSTGLIAGDVVYVELTTLHEQFTGSSDYSYSMSAIRAASL
jgi:hypothetical protein